jgi:hypothetical protein
VLFLLRRSGSGGGFGDADFEVDADSVVSGGGRLGNAGFFGAMNGMFGMIVFCFLGRGKGCPGGGRG